MTQQYARKLLLMVLVGACAISLSESLHAADPPGTTRFFFEYLSLDGNGPDWEAEGSRRIVVHDPDANGFSLLFGSPDYVSSFPFNFQLNDGEGNLLLDLTGTTWVRSSVLHITDDGVQVVEVGPRQGPSRGQRDGHPAASHQNGHSDHVHEPASSPGR